MSESELQPLLNAMTSGYLADYGCGRFFTPANLSSCLVFVMNWRGNILPKV